MESIERTEAGAQNEWKLEAVINWKRIVELYYTYHGEKSTAEAKAAAEAAE